MENGRLKRKRRLNNLTLKRGRGFIEGLIKGLRYINPRVSAVNEIPMLGYQN